MIKKCLICGKEFYVKPSREKVAKFCSMKCLGVSNKNNRNRLGVKHTERSKIKMRKANKGKHYSPNTEFRKGIIPWNKDKPYNAIKGDKNTNWRGGRKGGNGSYVYILQPNHPLTTKSGYVAEHRLVAEKCLSRYLTKLEIIHHINLIITDNRPENLYLFPNQSCHMAYHILAKNNLIELITKSNLPNLG